MGLPSHEASHATKETNLTWKKAGIHDATVNAHDLEYISRFCVKGETVKVVPHNECTFEKTDKRDGMLVFNRAKGFKHPLSVKRREENLPLTLDPSQSPLLAHGHASNLGFGPNQDLYLGRPNHG
jgi:hypothetical protein